MQIGRIFMMQLFPGGTWQLQDLKWASLIFLKFSWAEYNTLDQKDLEGQMEMKKKKIKSSTTQFPHSPAQELPFQWRVRDKAMSSAGVILLQSINTMRLCLLKT